MRNGIQRTRMKRLITKVQIHLFEKMRKTLIFSKKKYTELSLQKLKM
ncbi:hypothetical protein HMPREF9019_1792 [Hoylesella timonensis CRIS 5C-B1]|uniref:Uncharacterized protein n=1 Tax=Hoylesella timonensis CRIS 5C-B1 TaxID=679189 RepID=D1VZE0_9BACT|nr:hypothetical protein HMPREF9019_1792 [Hoylesella timonensis CRIS 5C-B1]